LAYFPGFESEKFFTKLKPHKLAYHERTTYNFMHLKELGSYEGEDDTCFGP